MARYMKDFPMNGSPEQMYAALRDYLISEGYEETQYKGENVLKKGDGWVSGPTVFKVSFLGNVMHLESWMLYAILPGVYGGEIGPTGVVGCATKGPWKNRIAQIERMFMPAYGGYAQSYQPGYQTPSYIQTQQPAYAQPQPAYAQPQQPAQDGPKAAFCSGCGAPLSGGAFCTNCGQPIA